MSSILRSPQLSTEKRTLAAQRSQSTPLSASAAAAASADQASAIQARVKQEVERVLAESRAAMQAEAAKELASAKERARQEGLRIGRAEGEAAAREAADAATTRLQAAIGALESALARGVSDLEDAMVDIVFEATTAIVGELAPTSEAIRALVRSAAARTRANTRLAVRLHPADLAVLRDTGGLEGVLQGHSALSWKADDTIILGGCVLETDSGELDARLETQLARLRTLLIDVRAARAGSGA